MGLFRPSRDRHGPDPYYHWKAILFSIGAAFGLGAMITGRDWLILVAVPILAVGVALRWLPREGAGETPPGPDEDDEVEDEASPHAGSRPEEPPPP